MCGKHIDDVKIIGTFSYDSKIVWNHDFRGFSNLVKDVVVANDPKPLVPYVSEDSNLHEEFTNTEINYQSLIAKKDKLFKSWHCWTKTLMQKNNI